MGKCGIINEIHSQKSKVGSKQEDAFCHVHHFTLYCWDQRGMVSGAPLWFRDTESMWAPRIWERTFHASGKELWKVLGHCQVRLLSFSLTSNKRKEESTLATGQEPRNLFCLMGMVTQAYSPGCQITELPVRWEQTPRQAMVIIQMGCSLPGPFLKAHPSPRKP